MENPEVPAVAPATESVTTPINSNPAPAQPAQPAQAPDMHGFTSEQLAEMRKFYDNNGGFEKVKARISNPEPKPVEPAQPAPQPQQPVQPQQSAYQAPFGSITRDEFLAQEYAQSLSRDPAYAAISNEIASGAILKDMARLNIRLVNQDGSLNDAQVREYLRLKAATVPAKQTNVTPEASAAPTVDYAPYDEKNMDMKQAMAILQQDSAFKSRGQAGHPHMKEAEEFMRNLLNKGKK